MMQALRIFFFGFLFQLLVLKITCSSPILDIPENNHGVEPLLLIGDKEEQLNRSRLLTVLPVLSAEWSVSFTIRLTSLDSSAWTNCNTIHMTHNLDNTDYGDRTPAVFLKGNPSLTTIGFRSAVNGQLYYGTDLAGVLTINEPIHFEIHQRYVSGGNYRFFIKINGEEVFTILNTDARQFYNVKVYASNPWYIACPGTIKNFKLTNFL